MQKCILQTLAPELLHKRLKATPEHVVLAAATESLTPPPVLVTNDLIVNANKMSAQVSALLPATTITNSPNNGLKESL